MGHLEKTEILITGATGTIGSEICRQLSKKGIPFRAMTLQGTDHYNKIYNLTGPVAMTHYEIANSLSQALDDNIEYINVSDEEMLKALLGVGFPDWQAHGLIEDYAHYARGEAENVTDDVRHVTGKNPRSFKDFLGAYADTFRPDN